MPLYCLAISAKRYALFNIDKDGKAVLRKASAHVLGHLMQPYSDEEAPPELPKPQFPLHELGVKRWQHDLWLKIIEAALSRIPDQVSYDWHPALKKPALSRYGATSPAQDHSPPSVIKKSRRGMHGWGPRIEHTPPLPFSGGWGVGKRRG